MNPMASVIVITPTTGSKKLLSAVTSIQAQLYPNLTHLIVIDGETFVKSTHEILNAGNLNRFKVLTLPYNTGKDGFNGHRIYAAVPYLIDSDYIFFLDEDNWYDNDHVSSLVQLMESENLEWSFSLRKICEHNGKFVTNDDCESLGDWPSYSGRKPLVDTSCYAMRGEVLKKICHRWYHPLGADRFFFENISQTYKKYKCSKLYSLNYRLHEHRPPNKDFFLKGNQFMKQKYKGYPWLNWE
jgi:glycosyltransferase involved in cell wall biosynthesis